MLNATKDQLSDARGKLEFPCAIHTELSLGTDPISCLSNSSLAVLGGSDGDGNCSRPSNTVGHMPIRNHLKDHAAFEPATIDAMSKALEKAWRNQRPRNRRCAHYRFGAQRDQQS